MTAICNWIHDNVEYLRQHNPLTSAFDTATERAGVCRDFAHLGIAFAERWGSLRDLWRVTHALEPPDFHAYFEAYLNGRWYIIFDRRVSRRRRV